MKFKTGAVFVAICVTASAAFADQAQGALLSGHGPVFGMTTPVNAKGARALDVGFMARKGETDDAAALRTMFSFGVTEDLQVSASIPYVLDGAALAAARMTGMMPGTSDVEAIVAWRFHRQGTGVGSRFESTAYAGLIMPGVQRLTGMARDLERALGTYMAVSSGVASRSHYVWGGLGYTRFAESGGDRRPEVFSYSAVWGYRPPALRKDYPHWDWRLFVELTGERAGSLRRDGVDHHDTRGHQVFLGPATLGIYKNFAIEGGIQFPVYQEVGAALQRERFRYALNVTRFF